MVKKVWGVDEKVVRLLTTMRWFVHADFYDIDLLFEAIELGFDPEEWEEKNGNKVLINGTWYKKLKR